MRRVSALVVVMLLTACFSSAPSPEGSERDYPTLTIAGFSVDAKIIQVQKEDVFLFEYETEADTAAEIARLSDDGRTIGGTVLPWKDIASVHIFATGTQIAVYPGSTKEVIGLLMQEGGSQVVGDPIE